ncbi:MAG: VOC family protein [Lentimicrobiaceae bacterium]|nr:VOC family protein [Lentimicrobiaceae bacterium]
MVEFILYVKNQQLSKDFYQKLLSASPVLDVPGMTEFLLEKNVKLGLMPEDGIQKILANRVPHPKTGNGIPRCELYLYVSDPGTYFNKAIQLGATVISELSPRDWGDEVAYCADTDGNILAFAKKINP